MWGHYTARPYARIAAPGQEWARVAPVWTPVKRSRIAGP